MGEGREAQEGGSICMITDSHCCPAETSTKMWSNCPPLKKKLKRKWKVGFAGEVKKEELRT